MELETDRLHMRQLREDHFDAFAAYLADEETARFVGGVKSRDEAWRAMAAILGHWTLKGFGLWAVEEKSSGNFVGCIGLWKPEGWPELEVGYWLTLAGQGKGYATEAATTARDYAYGTLGAKTLVSYIDPDNGPSKRVVERMGAWHDETIELLSHGPHCVYRHPSPDQLSKNTK